MAQSPDVRLVTETTLRRQLPALADELGIGGMGVPIFETLAEAEAWEATNPGKTALTIEAPPNPHEWVPKAPTFNVVNGTVAIPTDAGAVYQINGTTVTGTYTVPSRPATVTVFAVAKEGYTLAGTASWSRDFPEIQYAYDTAALALSPDFYFRLDEPAGGPYVNRGTNHTLEVAVGSTPTRTGPLGGFSGSLGPAGDWRPQPRIRNTPELVAASFATIIDIPVETSTATSGQIYHRILGGGGPGTYLGHLMTTLSTRTRTVSFHGASLAGQPIDWGSGTHHWAFTFDGATSSIYLDGALVASAPQTAPIAAQSYIQTAGNTGPTAGWVADLDRAWTPAEVKALSDAVVR